MVSAGSGNVPILLDMGVEVASVPGLADALDLPLCWSCAEDGQAPHRGAFDRHSAPVGVFPDVRVVWAAAVLAVHAVVFPIGLAVAEVVAASTAAVPVAKPVAAVPLAEALRVGMLDAGALPCDLVRLLQRFPAPIVHPLAGDAEFLATEPECSSLPSGSTAHVLGNVFGYFAQVAVMPAVPEGLWDSVVRGAVGPLRPIHVPMS